MANIVEILLRTRDEASKQLEGVSNQLRGVQNQLKPIAAVSGAAFAGLSAGIFKAASETAKFADEVQKTGLRTGLTTEFISSLGFAAEQSGAGFDDVINGIQKLQKSAADASIGLSTQKRAFDELGVSVTDQSGKLKQVDVLFTEVIDGLSNMEDQTLRVALSQDILGRAGRRLGPLIFGGVENMRALQKEAETLGIVIDKTAADQGAEFVDMMNSMKRAIQGAVFVVGREMIPELQRMAERIKEIAIKVADWTRDNSELVGSILKWGTAMVGVIAGLTTLGIILPPLIAGLAVLAGPVGLIALGIAAVTAAIIKLSLTSKELPTNLEDIESRMNKLNEENTRYSQRLKDIEAGHVKFIHATSKTAAIRTLTEQIEKNREETERLAEARDKLKAAELPEIKMPEFEVPVAELSDAYRQLEDKVSAMHQQAVAQRAALSVAGLEREISARVAAGEEDLNETTRLIYQKLDVELAARRQQYDWEKQKADEAFEEELEKIPERDERRAELEQAYLDAKRERSLALQEEITEMTLDADAEVEDARKGQDAAREARRKGEYKAWKADVVSIGSSLKTSVYGSLRSITDESITIRRFLQGAADVIWKQLVTGLAEMIVKLTIIKTLSKFLSFGLWSEGGVVTYAGSGPKGAIRAQRGLVVPSSMSNRAFARYSPDTVPLLASVGEAILPVWLTDALRDILRAGGGSKVAYQTGGVAAATVPGTPIWQLIVQGNLYANDQRQIDDMIRKISDAVMDRNLQLHATSAKELR